MSIFKVHRYGVRSYWLGRRLLTVEAPGKPTLRVATPPDFKNGIPSIWSPEELLVGSLATCFELTLVAIAERRDLPLHAIKVDATGHLEHRDGRYRFNLFELDVELEIEAGREHEGEELARLAKEHCIVGGALEAPVYLRGLECRAASLAATAAA